jgi:hypothetical protein
LFNDAFNSSGGYLTFSSTFTAAAPAASAEYQNFRNQTSLLYFIPGPVNGPTAAIANRVESINGQLYLTLWGSSGWNPDTEQFEAAGQGTGFDFRAHLVCPNNPPPIIPGCPCEEPASLHTVSRGCIQDGVPIRVTGNACVSLSFSEELSC